MEKRNISLKHISLNDESQMLDIVTSTVNNQTYMLPDFARREDAIPLFHRLIGLSNDEKRYVRGIYLDDLLIGYLNDVEIDQGAIELGYILHPDFHGRGYMTVALKKAIGELFSQGYQEVITGAFESNLASIRVMQKNDMTRMEKVDLIEYRGKTHRCIYYHLRAN